MFDRGAVDRESCVPRIRKYSQIQSLKVFEAYDNANDGNAATILKYVCLTKILNDTPNEVAAIMASKAGLKHAGPDLEALNAITNAVKAKSLEDFEKAVEVHAAYLKNDDLINHNLTDLYEKMFENNLVKINGLARTSVQTQ